MVMLKILKKANLHEAAAKGDIAKISKLVAKGADVNEKDDRGWSPLHAASDRKNITAIRKLIDLGADINIQDDQGWSPFGQCIISSDRKTARFLFSQGAKVDIRNKVNTTPLLLAASKGRSSICRFLIQHCKADATLVNINGETVSIIAAQNGDWELFSALIGTRTELGINTQDRDKRTALHYAAAGKSDAHYRIANAIIKIDSVSLDLPDKMSWTPLHHASASGRVQVCQILLGAKANPNSITGVNKATPLVIAATNDFPNIIQLLIKYGANPSLKDKRYWTPLHHAVFNDHIDCCKYLLLGGASPSSKDDAGCTPLYYAKHRKNEVTIKMLEDMLQVDSDSDDGDDEYSDPSDSDDANDSSFTESIYDQDHDDDDDEYVTSDSSLSDYSSDSSDDEEEYSDNDNQSRGSGSDSYTGSSSESSSDSDPPPRRRRRSQKR